MTHHSEPRLCTARSSGRPAVLAPHQPVDLLQPALLPPDGRQIAVCWACATHGLLQPSRRHGRIALLTTLALADSPSLGSASCSCFAPSAPSVDRLPILLADERTRVEAVKCHGDFAVLSSTAGCSSFSVWNSVWNSETVLVLGDGERRHAQAVGTRRSPAGRRDWIGFSCAFSSDHCGRNRAHITSSADPSLT